MRVGMLTLVGLLLVGQAELGSANPGGGPCAQIRAICEQAGFVTAGGRKGLGLLSDCIRPIMEGGHQPRRSAQPLPDIDPQIVAACKAHNPSFGIAHKSAPLPSAQSPTASPEEVDPANSGAAPPAEQRPPPAK
jgi:hypothetical protein